MFNPIRRKFLSLLLQHLIDSETIHHHKPVSGLRSQFNDNGSL